MTIGNTAMRFNFKKALGVFLLVAALGVAVFSSQTWLGGSAVAETKVANKQRPGVNFGLQNVRDYFDPDMELDDIKWEAFGTPEWAPDRMEMWPTDYVSLVLTGRASPQAIAEKFSGPSKQAAATPNAVRPWLSPPMQRLMQSLVDDKPTPGNVKCRALPTPEGRKYRSGFSCTDGEQVLYFLLLQSPSN